MSKLNKLLEQVDANKRPTAEQVVRELNFLNRTLTRLRKEVDASPLVEKFVNGKQTFDRESIALKQYNQTIQRFSTLHKQLVSLLPEDFQEDDDFERFLRGEDF